MDIPIYAFRPRLAGIAQSDLIMRVVDNENDSPYSLHRRKA